MKVTAVCSIHGPSTMIDATKTNILGTNVSVCSCICVTAWKRLMITPIMRVNSKIGIVSWRETNIACRAKSITSPSNIDTP